jgi:hypothetical protein
MNTEMKELLEQLKLVTKELAFQIAAQYQDITLEQIEERNPIVRKAIDTIEKYETE